VSDRRRVFDSLWFPHDAEAIIPSRSPFFSGRFCTRWARLFAQERAERAMELVRESSAENRLLH
jgi:hypothetical protein